jgi:hypothetical protein
VVDALGPLAICVRFVAFSAPKRTQANQLRA